MKSQYLVDGLALTGFDAVSVYSGNAKAGEAKIHTEYAGAVYQFASQENKMVFDNDPEKYAPKYGGYCSTAISEGALVEANPRSSLVQDGELHVFYKDEAEDTQDEWKENPLEIKKLAELEWEKVGQ